ncbi:MAG: glycoside hydrolase family 97 catalytic domain-containing protein [Prevotella sp.]|nr:glycoside hydrolase family 97 catalytic domain-containing protein [Prevotella sp.]
MKKLLLLFAFSLSLTVQAREATVSSPNGKLIVVVNDEGGQATYSVSLESRQMVLPSALGFKADFGDFTRGLKIVNTSAKQIDREYDMRQVKQSHIRYVATVLTVDFENTEGLKMSAEFSMSDNDVAFRYLIPRQKNDNPKSAVIYNEATAFCLPDGTTTFLTPQSGPMVGWERTKPSYEEEYVADAPMTTKSRYGQGYTFPCLFRVGSEGQEVRGERNVAWLLISETGVSSAYCGSHLSDYSPGGYTIAYPMAGENNGRGDTYAGIALPGSTPWRTITLGTSLKPIVETTIAYDVVEPIYTLNPQLSTLNPYGRYTWSWLIWQDNSINYDDQVKFIDLASAMGYEYCLVDNWWDQNIGRERIGELSRYAQSKGVSLMLWYNSNGYENNAPQTPRDCMNTGYARDREMAWMQKIGVKGIKVDFFGGDKQETMKLYEDILYDANRYGLQCIFHGCTIPRGWERMYPNYVASEAVLASENVFFNDGAARREPFDLTMHPFCRNAVGTMDWGGVIMNKHMSKDNKSRHQRMTTDIFEIASAFTNQTAVQCIAMQPNNLEELPQVELDFLKTIPTTWDETRFIDGYPGRYVVLARRHADKWYVAGLNANKEPLKLTLSLDMFAPGTTLSQLNDVADKKGNITGVATLPLKTDKKQQAKITIQPNGGIVIY